MPRFAEDRLVYLVGSVYRGPVSMLIFENFSALTKATSGRPAYAQALYQIMSSIAKYLVSFRCQFKIREGQAEETAWRYGCNRWWRWTCGHCCSAVQE